MNKEKMIKFLWISMWATLILMDVLKLTFNYYYPIVIENSKLLKISKYIDDNKWLDYIISFPFYIVNSIIIYLCSVKEKWFLNKKHLIIILLGYTLAYPCKIINPWLGLVAIIIPYILLPIFLTRNNKKWILIMFLLDNIFQILSNITRGNNLIIQETYIIRTCMGIDYYLLFLIYYIGGCHMGLQFVLPWFTKKETVINAKIEKLEKKIKKLEEQKVCLKKR